MKKNYKFPVVCAALIASTFLTTTNLNAQNIGINATGAAPAASAGLDVNFTNKGLLTPRLTTAQKNAIAAPANGLMVFDTDLDCHYIYSTTLSKWKSLCDNDVVYGETTTLYAGATTLLRTLSVTVTSVTDKVILEAEFDYAKGMTNSYVALCVYRNGVEIHEIAKYSVANADNSIKATWVDIPGIGTHSYQIRYYIGGGAMSFVYGHNLVAITEK